MKAHKQIKIVDDGSRYTIHQSLRQKSGEYSNPIIVAEHLNKADTLNLMNTLNNGIVGFSKELRD